MKAQSPAGISHPRLRVCAVSYLNTVPLVWGMQRGAERGLFDLSFAIPSACADQLEAGEVDIGIVPTAEIARLGLETIPGLGIASRGAVRSILLISKVEPARIRTLAADASSRTSVQLARVLLSRKFNSWPEITRAKPNLDAMLRSADAALVIGDPALGIDPESLPYRVLDLGSEWTSFTGLPMVFAQWAGRPGVITGEVRNAFLSSARAGMAGIDEIAAAAEVERGLPRELAARYLRENVVFELGDREHAGLHLFLEYAAASDDSPAARLLA